MEIGKLTHTDLYGTRLLVFLEDSPQSNKYRQVYLNAEEFKKLSLSLGTVKKAAVSEDDVDEVEINYSEEIYDLPDLKEIH